MTQVGVFVTVHKICGDNKGENMGCGLQDISEGHEQHYCHKCANVSFLGSQDDNRPCKICLNIGNCNFDELKKKKRAKRTKGPKDKKDII